jgi:hypothetical protein
MSQTCEVKRIQQNSAQAMIDQATQAFNQAKSDYLSCLGPQEQGAANLEDAKPAMDKIEKEVEALVYMERFILGQLEREAKNGTTVSVLADSAREESNKISNEIEELRTEIRTEKRRFLDANPSKTTAVAGIYFTGEPDNQVLIAFLSCFGAFLLFSGLLIIMNHIPVLYLQALTMNERLTLVGTIWVVALVITYLGFFTFT